MRIGYIVPRLFTFIANEMVEVQKAGHELVMVPLYPAGRFQLSYEKLERLKPDIIMPAVLFDPIDTLIALWVVLTRPIRVINTLVSLHWAAGLNPFAHARLIGIALRGLATGWRLRRAKVDHIHAHFATDPATCAAIASKISGIPYSFTAHAYDIYCTKLSLRNDTLQWKLRHANKVVVVSNYAADILRQLLPAPARDRVQTIYVGIPLDLFCEMPPQSFDGKLRMLCVGNLVRKKGIDTLIDACSVLRNRGIPFHLRIYGDGPLREALAKQIEWLDLSDHVVIGDPISQQEVACQMGACHIFILPCRKDPKTGSMDGIPTVFMEAMATGRPVVSCPISGIPEIVRDGETGLLVPPDNPHALATAIARLAGDDLLRIKLGKQARALVERQHDQALNSRCLLDLLAPTKTPPLTHLVNATGVKSFVNLPGR
jgi:glycosyltransferase involved in cell wall biosynthesis